MTAKYGKFTLVLYGGKIEGKGPMLPSFCPPTFFESVIFSVANRGQHYSSGRRPSPRASFGPRAEIVGRVEDRAFLTHRDGNGFLRAKMADSHSSWPNLKKKHEDPASAHAIM
jgi:hypothetical protein